MKPSHEIKKCPTCLKDFEGTKCEKECYPCRKDRKIRQANEKWAMKKPRKGPTAANKSNFYHSSFTKRASLPPGIFKDS